MKTNYEKTIATLMAALLALSPVAVSATTVSNAFQALGANGSLNAVVVVGSGAAASDVAGAVDIAVRLATLSYNPVTTTGTSGNVNGLEKKDIDINFGNMTDSSAFPSTIRTFHYSGLQQGSTSYKGNSYNFHEEFLPGNTYFSHDFGTSGINGTETMVVQGNQVKYRYVFDQAINCTALATTAQNTCTLSTLEYTNPIKITMLGKPFVIVGIGSNQATMLSGSVGTATATSGVTFGTYTVYSDLGNSGSWARIIVKDSNGNTVETATMNQGDSKDFTTEGISVKVTNVRALQDGTVVGTDLVVGTIGSTQITYSASCSVGGTGSSNTNFPGESNWCIQTSGFANSGAIAANDAIVVVYKPSTSPQYFKYAGSVISLPFPNNYGNMGFEGWNYNTFATLTFKTVEGVSAYNLVGAGSTNSTIAASSLNGIEVSSDVAGSLVDPFSNTGYNKVAVFFNTTYGSAPTVYPMLVGFYDSTNSRWGVNVTGCSTGNSTASHCAQLAGESTFAYNVTVSYGGGAAAKDQQQLYFKVQQPGIASGVACVNGGQNSATSCGSLFTAFQLGTIAGQTTSPPYVAYSNGLLFNWVNKTTTWSSTTPPTFRLYTSDSSETKDVQALNTPSGGGALAFSDVGQSSQDVVANSGVIVVTPGSYTGGQQVLVKVPAQALGILAYVGKIGAGTTTTGGTVNVLVPVTSPIALLDTEVTSAVYSKNMVLVGGPCVNSIVASMAANGTFKYTCTGWPGSNFGYVSVADNVYSQGKVVVVIAGTRASDTRLAADVFQNYDTLLSGQTTAAVQVTGSTTSPSIVPG